jgi:hypothetical protein
MGFFSDLGKAVEKAFKDVGNAVKDTFLGGGVSAGKNSSTSYGGYNGIPVTQTNTTGNNGNKDKGDSSSPAPPPSVAQPTQTLKPIHFTVTCTGLKPDTVHQFYYEGIDVTQYCKAVGAASGSTTLKTGNSGSITFDFNFTTNVEKYVDGLNKVGYDLAGDKKFELRATGSSASKIIPFKY